MGVCGGVSVCGDLPTPLQKQIHGCHKAASANPPSNGEVSKKAESKCLPSVPFSLFFFFLSMAFFQCKP